MRLAVGDAVALEDGKRDLVVGTTGHRNEPVGRPAEHGLKRVGEGVRAVAGRVDQRAVDVPENEAHGALGWQPLLGPLAIPPRLLMRALDDLHVLAENLPALRSAAEALPGVEDELATHVDSLNERVDRLFTEMDDLDDTAENLEDSLRQLHGEVTPLTKEVEGMRSEIRDLHAEIRDLRDRIPGI